MHATVSHLNAGGVAVAFADLKAELAIIHVERHHGATIGQTLVKVCPPVDA